MKKIQYACILLITVVVMQALETGFSNGINEVSAQTSHELQESEIISESGQRKFYTYNNSAPDPIGTTTKTIYAEAGYKYKVEYYDANMKKFRVEIFDTSGYLYQEEQYSKTTGKLIFTTTFRHNRTKVNATEYTESGRKIRYYIYTSAGILSQVKTYAEAGYLWKLERYSTVTGNVYEITTYTTTGHRYTVETIANAGYRLYFDTYATAGYKLSRIYYYSSGAWYKKEHYYSNGTVYKVETPTGPLSTKLSNPVRNSYTVTSRYGWRGSYFHNGIDLSSPRGTAIYSVASGKVVEVGTGCPNYATPDPTRCNGRALGNYVVIQHTLSNGEKFTSVSAHLQNVYVREGQNVDSSTRIGTMGNSGWTEGSTGVHLHFEIAPGHLSRAYYVHKNSVNPEHYIKF